MAQKASPKKRKRQGAQSAETRRKIIDAALAIAAVKGFEMATTAEIAKQAGVSEGSIYNYFRTKDELLVNMVGEYAGSFLAELNEKIAAENSALDKIDRLIRFHIWFFTEKGNIFQVIHGKRPGTKVQMARIIQVAIVPYVSLIEEIIREGIARGEFRKVNPEVAASFLIGGMQLALLAPFFDIAEGGPDQTAEQIRNLFLGGLSAE